MSTLQRILTFGLVLLLAACANSGGNTPPSDQPAVTESNPTLQATDTPSEPTATSVPMAALVNGEGITLDEFNNEVLRYTDAQTGLGKTVSETDAAAIVLDDLIAQTLLAQGAVAAGFSMDDAALQARIDKLAADLGGADQLSAWMEAHHYTEDSFRGALKRAVASAWMRDKIISAVPVSADQVHVRQILLYNEEAARNVLAQLRAGSDFDTLAAYYDPVTRGDIGWFPKGYLPEPSVEEAAFALKMNEISEVISSEVGYHILKVIETGSNRPLAPDALLALQNRALADWVKMQREQSTTILSP